MFLNFNMGETIGLLIIDVYINEKQDNPPIMKIGFMIH